jgi:hypothetical protein
MRIGIYGVQPCILRQGWLRIAFPFLSHSSKRIMRHWWELYMYAIYVELSLSPRFWEVFQKLKSNIHPKDVSSEGRSRLSPEFSVKKSAWSTVGR